jgi:hypothetical protein
MVILQDSHDVATFQSSYSGGSITITQVLNPADDLETSASLAVDPTQSNPEKSAPHYFKFLAHQQNCGNNGGTK